MLTAKITIQAAKNGWIIQHTPLELLKQDADFNPQNPPEPTTVVFQTMDEATGYLNDTFDDKEAA